jgi:hypothetical protein
MFDPTQLDQINDVVQRTGFSDKRKRNEAIRAGMENPGAFQEQNAGYIQEAQQPSEYMGAGRKLAANQNPDSSIASLFKGNLAKHGNEWYSYGDTDYSGAQFGTTGYTLKDLGYGKYDILDQNNNSLGTSYGPVRDAITAYANANINQAASSWTPSVRWDDSGKELPWGASTHEQGQIDPYTTNPYLGQEVYVPPYNSELGNWEALGQMINGSSHSMGGYFPVGNGGVPYADSLARNPHNNRADLISGLNTLYGSTPLIMNNKLLGYKMDLGPGSDSSPFADQITKNSKKEQMNSQLWRTLVEPEKWASLSQRIGDGEDVFVPTANADKLPGWLNEDQWNYAKAPRTGAISNFFGKWGPILKMTPLAPFSYFADAARGMESGNFGAIPMAAFQAYLGAGSSDMAGAAGVDQMPSGGFSGADLVDYPAVSSQLSNAFGSAAPALTGAVMGALGSGNNPLMGAISGAASSAGRQAVGNLIGGNTLGDLVAKMSGGAAGRGLTSIFNQNKAIHGSEQVGRSGGLNALLNSTPSTNDVYQQTPEEQQQVKENLQRRAIQQVQLRQQGRI